VYERLSKKNSGRGAMNDRYDQIYVSFVTIAVFRVIQRLYATSLTDASDIAILLLFCNGMQDGRIENTREFYVNYKTCMHF